MTAAPQQVPALRPEPGFVVKTEEEKPRPGFNRPACWYVNFTKHPLVGMPLTPNGQPTDKEHLLARGLGNLQVPLDLGTFRKLKEAAEGARRPTYCIDVVFNPFVVKLFMDDAFCKSMADFRAFVIGLAFKNVERELRRTLSQSTVTLVKSMFYKDGLGKKQDMPREFVDLPGGIEDETEASAQGDVRYKAADTSSDSGFTLKTSKQPASSEDGKPLIEECASTKGSDTFAPPARKKGSAIKKGFLNNTGGKLYGEEGSKEGVLPENAGDPLGYLPKGLRQTCKVVDCNSPEYQKHEEQRKVAERHNTQVSEFNNQLTRDLASWNNTQDKWHEDKPIGDDKPKSPTARYSNDYSRFADLEEEPDAPAPAESRDWYFDEKGNRRTINAPSSGSSAHVAQAAEESPKSNGKPAVKKGFLTDTKGSIYGEEGSAQGGSAIDKEKQKQAIEELSRSLLSSDGEEAKQLAEILGSDGKEAAGKMASFIQESQAGSAALGCSGAAKARSPSGGQAGTTAESGPEKGGPLSEQGMADALKLLGDMVKASGRDADPASIQKVMGDLTEKMKGVKGKDPAAMEAQLSSVWEMLEGLGAGGSSSGSDVLMRESGMDAPDRAEVAAAKQPAHKIEREEGALRLTVQVPGLTSMKDVGLDVSVRLASLSFPSEVGLEPVHAELPADVVPTAARAKFSKKTRTLTVSMPLAAAA